MRSKVNIPLHEKAAYYSNRSWLTRTATQLKLKVTTISLPGTVFGLAEDPIDVISVSGNLEATILFYQTILDKTDAEKDQDHMPVLMNIESKGSSGPILGVIGGMGPEATLYFLNLLKKPGNIQVFSNTCMPKIGRAHV